MNKLFLVFLLGIFSVSAFSATKTWSGGGANNKLQNAANWTDNIAPATNDDLIFPAVSAQYSINDSEGATPTFGSITIEGGNYTFSGLGFRLNNGLTILGGTQTFGFVFLGPSSQTFTAAQGSSATFAFLALSSTPVNSPTLTLEGAGNFGIATYSGYSYFKKNGSGAALIAGRGGFNQLFSIMINDGVMIIDANMPETFVTVNGGAVGGQFGFSGLGGTGSVGETTVSQGTISAGSLTSPTGRINTRNLVFSANGNYVCKIAGPTPGQLPADQINVTGTVSLNNARLVPIPLNNFQPPIGTSYTILNNDGSDAIGGTFLNAPEGAIFGGALNTAFRITYQGGDGNDVVITRVPLADFDFDGDGKSDAAVFRPSNSVWYQLRSANDGFFGQQFGLSTDKIVPADYDGDNKTDVAVYRPENGGWYIFNSSNATVTSIQFGLAEDIPVPNDFDGDGKADPAVFRPSNGVWYQLRSIGNQFYAQQFGQSGDVPQVGDFDGDGFGDLVVFRQGVWHEFLSSTNSYTAFQFGIAGDKSVPADYDGDGKTDAAVYRGGVWYLLKSSAGFTAIQWGIASDIPAPADYDGDGKTDPAIYRDGVWYQQRTTAGISIFSFGLSGDKPIPSAFGQ